MSIGWMNTGTYRKNGEPRGWKLHAVELPNGDDTKVAEIVGTRSACGLSSRNGWDIDLFIEKKCARCLRTLGLACPNCRGRGDLGRKHQYGWCSVCMGTGEVP